MDYTPWAFAPGYKLTPGCVSGMFITDYLNRADVRQALKIPTNIQGWEMCNGPINEDYVKV